MNDCNFDILKENIRKHMSDKHMTQNDVAKALNTTQANIAKHLKKGDDAQTFTLKQVYLLADLFETSVDELLGRKNNNVQNITPEDICSLLTTLLDADLIQCIPHVTEQEEVWNREEYNPAEISHYKRNANYYAFYFPEFIPVPKYIGLNEYQQYIEEYEEYGNFNFNNYQINKYLNRFIEAFINYRKGINSKEVYEIVVKAYSDELKKIMEKVRSYSKPKNNESDK